MTKELRKKFILINMALVGTVLLIVFAVLCFQNYQRLEQDSMRVMERYFNDNGARPVPELEFDKKREWRNFPLMLSFCAVVDSNGELVSYQSDNLTVSEATVSQAVEVALDKMESSGKNSGTLSGLDLRYLARGQQGQMWIAFVDRTQEYASMRSFLTSALQAGGGGAGCPVSYQLLSVGVGGAAGGAQLGAAAAVCGRRLARAQNPADGHPGQHRHPALPPG